jgi:hypothetical protein
MYYCVMIKCFPSLHLGLFQQSHLDETQVKHD